MSRIFLPLSLLTAIIACALLKAAGSNSLLVDPYAREIVVAVQDTVPPRFGDFLTDPSRNPFDLNDPSIIEKNVEYDPETGNYIITEKIGEEDFRPPTYMTFREYMEYTRKQQEQEYFQRLAGISAAGGGSSALDPLAKFDVRNSLVDRLFGGTNVDIRPQGNIDMTFGVDFQRLENPILTERQRRQGGFDFDMNIQMNVSGKIGEKLNLNTNYNTAATFDFDNQIKLNYNSDAFSEDEIIKRIDAGNVSLPLRGSLIQGAQSLFGVITELQFGRLRLTAVASQQKSQQESIQIRGGGQVQEFEVRADEYDENRHFFLTHYNRNTFEGALENLPQIKSLFRIESGASPASQNPFDNQRQGQPGQTPGFPGQQGAGRGGLGLNESLENIEIWITNDRNEVDNVRDIVALADLGETDRLVNPGAISLPPTPAFPDLNGRALPENDANDLYRRIINTPGIRQIDQAVNILQTQFGLQQARDFEKVSARRLRSSEYTVHPELGFISLNVNVQPDQVVGVAFRYTYNGRNLKVGELSTNLETTSSDSSLSVLFVKLLKSTTQRIDVSTWDLMMKNVYPIGAFQVNREDFKLDVYYDDPGKGLKRFLPESNLAGQPLLRVFNLDNLNVQGDPQPDGVFDFVPGLTINTRNGRIMFPVLEPFGSSLARQIDEQAFRDKFTYQELYDLTLFQAQEFPEKNRYVIRGSYKSSVSSEISLGAFNIPPGSVRVSAGGQILLEGRDYEVDYNIGRVKILNDAILNSGVPINVSFEDNTLFGFQLKSMFGLRADYEVDKNFHIGATFLNLFERPFTQKVNIGDDPINNRIYGLDVNFQRNAPWLTRMVDALPFLQTKADSRISFAGEAAFLSPGHNRAINQSRNDKGGVVYIDDFEGAASSFDLRQPVNQWFLASTPQNDDQNNNPLFPESILINDLRNGANRARLNWYRIDQQFRNQEDQRNPFTSVVPQVEVFPNAQIPPDQLPNVQTLDLTFYPRERGPYNFDVPEGYPGYTTGLAFMGDSLILRDPETRWGGIMRALNTNDFQSANIEFLEFWLLSPFLDPEDPLSPAPDYLDKQGDFYINLGNISEDVLRDSRMFFENGLPGPANPNRRVDTTAWSVIPITQQITRAFDNDDETRRLQDVGLDGMDDVAERAKFSDYIEAIRRVNPLAADKVARDPANDNYRYYGDNSFANDAGILTRYRDYNNPEGNSRPNEGGTRVSSATNIPDSEDINRDNTLNETESYFQYRIPIRANPLNPREIDMNVTPFITDRQESDDRRRVWYRFRIPLNGPDKVSVGGILDFRSIRFMRMYMRGFRETTTLRFARLELVRNTWRRYTQELSPNPPPCAGQAVFDVDVVNIERNASRQPFNYVLPEGIQRQQTLGVFNTLQNEQSISMVTRNLCEGEEVAIFKNINLDMRVYERFKMFVHAEELDGQRIPEGALSIFVRLGSDFRDNYYEYEIPLVMSDVNNLPTNPNSAEYKNEVWRPENEFDFALRQLVDHKQARNDAGFPLGEEFTLLLDPDNPALSHRLKIKGNPNVGFVKTVLVGIRNPRGNFTDSYNTEVWINEMRLTGLDERGGMAAIGRVDFELADFGNVTLSGNYSSIGFGALDQRVQQRQREDISGYDVAGAFQLGKLFPDRWGIRLPFYTQFSRQTRSPEFDPYDLDIKLRDKLQTANASDRDSIRLLAQDISTLRTFTFTNVGKDRRSARAPKPWDIENFSVTYAFSDANRRDPLIEFDQEQRRTAGLNYAFSLSPKYIQPLKNLIEKDKYLKLLTEFNFNPIPNSFTFSTIMDRRFATTRYRFTGLDDRFNTFFNKSFVWDRDYNLQWDLTRSLKLNFNAVNAAVIDEPDEIKLLEDPTISDPAKVRRDSIWRNITQFGRTKNYLHSFQLSYNLPTRYIPFMDWVQVRAQYQGEYGWTAAALNVDSLGNVIQNRQNRQLSADLNFEALYNKWSYLQSINRAGGGRGAPGGDRRGAPGAPPGGRPQGGQTAGREVSTIEQLLIRPLMLVRRGRLNYSERFSTSLPGYMPQSRLMGMSPGFGSPGFGFIAGLQPRIRGLQESEYYTANDWLHVASQKGWITSNVLLNREVVQEYNQNFDARLTVEPFRDFRIDLEAVRDFTETHTEYFKDTLNDGIPRWAHVVPKQFGSLTVTYSALRTLFRDSREEIITLFKTFESNRVVISRRIGEGEHADPILAAQGFTEGYGRNQQDVLIPAFIAAYTGQDPNEVSLDLFGTRPRINWRLTYTGLARLPLFRDMFQNFSLTHGYRSTFSVNSYGTGLDWLRTREFGAINELNNNFFPRIEIPQIGIQEGFSPLLAIDASLKNGMSFNIDYKKARNLGMSFISNQLSETQTKEIIIGFAYLLRDINLPFFGGDGGGQAPPPGGAPPGQGRRPGQSQMRDLEINFNFSLRDDVTFNHLLDQGVIEPTRGNYSLSISPSAQYQISSNLALRLFFDYRRNEPKTSAGFPRTDTAGGVILRFQLN